MNAIISGDIVASTTLSELELQRLAEEMNTLFEQLSRKYNPGESVGFWARLIKGDYIECYVEDPRNSLRIALLVKTAIKKFAVEKAADAEQQKKRDLFRKYGVRIAIGVGSMRTVDIGRGILDGEAIYLSGRKLDDQKSSNKEKVVIKNTLFFEVDNEPLKEQGTVLLELLDVLLNNATARQCEVVHLKMLGLSELEIADQLGIRQASVNQHSTAVGWNAIEHALAYFERLNF